MLAGWRLLAGWLAAACWLAGCCLLAGWLLLACWLAAACLLATAFWLLGRREGSCVDGDGGRGASCFCCFAGVSVCVDGFVCVSVWLYICCRLCVSSCAGWCVAWFVCLGRVAGCGIETLSDPQTRLETPGDPQRDPKGSRRLPKGPGKLN